MCSIFQDAFWNITKNMQKIHQKTRYIDDEDEERHPARNRMNAFCRLQ